MSKLRARLKSTGEEEKELRAALEEKTDKVSQAAGTGEKQQQELAKLRVQLKSTAEETKELRAEHESKTLQMSQASEEQHKELAKLRAQLKSTAEEAKELRTAHEKQTRQMSQVAEEQQQVSEKHGCRESEIGLPQKRRDEAKSVLGIAFGDHAESNCQSRDRAGHRLESPSRAEWPLFGARAHFRYSSWRCCSRPRRARARTSKPCWSRSGRTRGSRARRSPRRRRPRAWRLQQQSTKPDHPVLFVRIECRNHVVSDSFNIKESSV